MDPDCDVMEQSLQDKAQQILTDYLMKNKHRKTPERYAILKKIYSIDGHFNVEKLYEMMLDENFRVSRATLYNSILLFTEANLIIRHQFGNTAQYEKALNNGYHHHMICTECGKVSEFQDEKLQNAITETKLKRFNATHYSLYVYGICTVCSRKNKKLNNNTKTNKKNES